MNDDLICPKCGSDYIKFNAFDGVTPIEKQFMYTCGECQYQFNPDEPVQDDTQPNGGGND